MKRQLTYKYGGRTLTDCPLCGQAARVDRHGARLSIRCYAGCDGAEVLAAFKRGQKPPPPPSTELAPPDPVWGFAFTPEQIRELRRG